MSKDKAKDKQPKQVSVQTEKVIDKDRPTVPPRE